MKRYLVLLLASLSLIGCASGPVRLPVENLSASAQTLLVDVRPKGEGTREIFSLIVTSERYGYYRLAQDVTDPSGPRLFAHRLQEKFGARPVPQTTLLHFVVYMNKRAELKSIALGSALGGVVGASISSQGNARRDGDVVHTMVDDEKFEAFHGGDEFKRAQYSESELASGTSAFVIFIETEAEGKRRFTRSLLPIKPPKEGQLSPLHQALESAIQFHLNS